VQLLVGAISPASCTVFAGFATPYSTCQLVVPPGTFTTSGVTLAVAVRLMVNAVIVQTTSLGNVYLAPLPTQTNPVAVGIYFQAPIYVAVPGDTLVLRMYTLFLCVLFSSRLSFIAVQISNIVTIGDYVMILSRITSLLSIISMTIFASFIYLFIFVIVI
jgi:hypothetical protein